MNIFYQPYLSFGPCGETNFSNVIFNNEISAELYGKLRRAEYLAEDCSMEHFEHASKNCMVCVKRLILSEEAQIDNCSFREYMEDSK